MNYWRRYAKESILEEWVEITKELCNKLINTMNNRYKMTINNKGDPNKY